MFDVLRIHEDFDWPWPTNSTASSIGIIINIKKKIH